MLSTPLTAGSAANDERQRIRAKRKLRRELRRQIGGGGSSSESGGDDGADSETDEGEGAGGADLEFSQVVGALSGGAVKLGQSLGSWWGGGGAGDNESS